MIHSASIKIDNLDNVPNLSSQIPKTKMVAIPTPISFSNKISSRDIVLFKEDRSHSPPLTFLYIVEFSYDLVIVFEGTAWTFNYLTK